MLRVLFVCLDSFEVLITKDQDLPKLKAKTPRQILSTFRSIGEVYATLSPVKDAQGVECIVVFVPRSGKRLAKEIAPHSWVSIESVFLPSELLFDVLYSIEPLRSNPALTESEALRILKIDRISANDPDKLKKAYRKASLESHPDRGGSEEIMKEVNEAYYLLKRLNASPDESNTTSERPRASSQEGKTRGSRRESQDHYDRWWESFKKETYSSWTDYVNSRESKGRKAEAEPDDDFAKAWSRSFKWASFTPPSEAVKAGSEEYGFYSVPAYRYPTLDQPTYEALYSWETPYDIKYASAYCFFGGPYPFPWKHRLGDFDFMGLDDFDIQRQEEIDHPSAPPEPRRNYAEWIKDSMRSRAWSLSSHEIPDWYQEVFVPEESEVQSKWLPFACDIMFRIYSEVYFEDRKKKRERLDIPSSKDLLGCFQDTSVFVNAIMREHNKDRWGNRVWRKFCVSKFNFDFIKEFVGKYVEDYQFRPLGTEMTQTDFFTLAAWFVVCKIVIKDDYEMIVDIQDEREKQEYNYWDVETSFNEDNKTFQERDDLNIIDINKEIQKSIKHFAGADEPNILNKEIIDTYHKQLTMVLSKYGEQIFRFGQGATVDYSCLSICCGGPSTTRIQFFEPFVKSLVARDVKATEVALYSSNPQYKTDLDRTWVTFSSFGDSEHNVSIRNSLIGYMTAQVIVLFFKDTRDFNEWLNRGTESNFLRLTQPVNKNKSFIVVCPEKLPINEIKKLTGSKFVSTRLDLSQEIALRGSNIRPDAHSGLVLVPRAKYYNFENETPFLMLQSHLTDFDLNYEHIDRLQPLRRSGMAAIKSHLILRPVDKDSEISREMFALETIRIKADYSEWDYFSEDSVFWRKSYYDEDGYALREDEDAWETTGLMPPLSDRLSTPYAKEWEFAATALSPFKYAGSNNPNNVGWTNLNSGALYENLSSQDVSNVLDRYDHYVHRRAVGQKDPNVFGLYDMTGNVNDHVIEVDRRGAERREFFFKGGSMTLEPSENNGIQDARLDIGPKSDRYIRYIYLEGILSDPLVCEKQVADNIQKQERESKARHESEIHWQNMTEAEILAHISALESIQSDDYRIRQILDKLYRQLEQKRNR